MRLPWFKQEGMNPSSFTLTDTLIGLLSFRCELSKAWFKRRTFHVPNRITTGSTQMIKFDV